MDRSILVPIRESSSKSTRKLALDEFLEEMTRMGKQIGLIGSWLPDRDFPEEFRSQYKTIVKRTKKELGTLRAEAFKSIDNFVDFHE